MSSWSSVLRVSHLPVCSPLPRAVLWGTPWAHLYPDSLTTLSYHHIWLPHLYTAFPVTLLAAISKNGPHRLICSNTVSGTVWEGWPCWKRCVTLRGQDLGFNTLTPFLVCLSLSCEPRCKLSGVPAAMPLLGHTDSNLLKPHVPN